MWGGIYLKHADTFTRDLKTALRTRKRWCLEFCLKPLCERRGDEDTLSWIPAGVSNSIFDRCSGWTCFVGSLFPLNLNMVAHEHDVPGKNDSCLKVSYSDSLLIFAGLLVGWMFFPQSFLHSLGKVLFWLIFGKYFSGWWFQIIFMFTPIWGRCPIWLIFFKGVETTSKFWVCSALFWGNACNACNGQDGNQANHKVNRVLFSLVVCLLFFSDAPVYLFKKIYL